MGFCYLFCQFFVTLIIGLSFCLFGLPQMALNIDNLAFYIENGSTLRLLVDWRPELSEWSYASNGERINGELGNYMTD